MAISSYAILPVAADVYRGIWIDYVDRCSPFQKTDATNILHQALPEEKGPLGTRQVRMNLVYRIVRSSDLPLH